jgi:hypothetical protein
MGSLSGRYGQTHDLSRAFRFQARHPDWSIRTVNGGSTFVATQNLDHSAHVIAMHSLAKLMDRLESLVSSHGCLPRSRAR